MERFIEFVDKVSMWTGKAFAWCILVMTFGVGYEVFMRYVLRDPTSWAFDISYMMYGTLFMMAGAYTLSRDGHVRGDVLYRLWKPATQAKVELVLYFIFFFPGMLALVFAGWKYASRSWSYNNGWGEVSVMSPANVPIAQFKSVIVVAGALLVLQGIAQVCRCILTIRTGQWPRQVEDVEELEDQLLRGEYDVLKHQAEAIDVVRPSPVQTPAAAAPPREAEAGRDVAPAVRGSGVPRTGRARAGKAGGQTSSGVRKPRLMAQPRTSGADDLKKISGVGPKLEKLLNSLGVYHYDQIAKWSDAEAGWVDNELKFKGRIARDGWIAQAQQLAASTGVTARNGARTRKTSPAKRGRQ